ncbi:MerR family transcriptional regulator [Leifsonia sp. NPDC058292]|uniref:MerR family transcriptional regulator n=1 Tax=Leifsonia sp. NPDC058292 TaxID=3346428 RepID=UPI0036DF4A68
MTQTLVSIGDFSRMTHLTIKALRYYHEVGLLEPRAIDPASGYRQYATDQVPIAQVVKRLRALSMPIEEVRDVVAAPDVGARNLAIAAHLQRMEQQLAQTSSAVSSLRSLLDPAADPSRDVVFRSTPAQQTIAIEGDVDFDGGGPWLLAAMRELTQVAQAVGLNASGSVGALFPRELFEEGSGRLVVFLPVREAQGSQLPAGRVVRRELPASDSAVMVHRGRHTDMDTVYGLLGSYVAERAIGVAGPIREDFVVSPLQTDRVQDLLTEVVWPVFRTWSS